MATGLGKTITAAFVLKGLWDVKKGRTLFLCHQNNILAQAKEEYINVLDGSTTFGLFHGDVKTFESVDVLFASFRTMVEWKSAFRPDEFDYIFVDESHHGHAPTYREVIEYFTSKVLVGMTATPDRDDQKDIRDIFGQEVVNISLEEGIANGWLSPVEYHIMSDDLDQEALKKLTDDVLTSGVRFTKKQINELIFIKRRDESIAEKILSYSGKKIIFCESVAHAENFKQFIPGSEVCHSKQSPKRSERIIENFRSGLLQHILVVDKFNEGIDIPDAEVVVFLRCTESRTIFIQQLGRGLRKSEGKEKVVVLDFVANCQRIQVVRSLIQGIQSLGVEGVTKVPLHIIGKGFDFAFSDEMADIFDVLDKIQLRYISDFPELLKEYSVKNKLEPEEVLAGTHQKLWWKCSKEDCGHEWPAASNSRLNGNGCPACANMVVTSRNNLAARLPELAKEYMSPPKNELTADKIVAGSNKKVWWKCSKDECGHEWEAAVATRKNGIGCPACSGRAATSKQNLSVTNPELAKEYMPPPRNELPANMIKEKTGKKVWWKCSKPDCAYEWPASGNSRSRGNGCPACANQVLTERNNLAALYPELAKEYMSPPKNELPANKIFARSTKRVWWKCSKEHCKHEWIAKASERVETGCPACAGKHVTEKNNLTVTHPELAKEYMSPPKNILPAEKIIAGTNKKLWWKCSVEICKHEWQSQGSDRSSGNGCPECNRRNRRKKK